MILLFLSFFFFTFLVQADILPCDKDDVSVQLIKKSVADFHATNAGVRMLEVKNYKYERIGFVFYYKEDGILDYIRFCGDKPNFFYLKGRLADLKSGFFTMYNDDYTAKVSLVNLDKQSVIYKLEIIPWQVDSNVPQNETLQVRISTKSSGTLPKDF